MSMMGELQNFFGLQIHQSKENTFINQDKYCEELIKILVMDKKNIFLRP